MDLTHDAATAVTAAPAVRRNPSIKRLLKLPLWGGSGNNSSNNSNSGNGSSGKLLNETKNNLFQIEFFFVEFVFE